MPTLCHNNSIRVEFENPISACGNQNADDCHWRRRHETEFNLKHVKDRRI
jgi:hypothetical protein